MCTQFRLAELLAEKRRTTGQKLTYEEIQKETGISPNTLSRMARNRNRLVSLDVMDKLCDFLNCEPGELFARVPNGPCA